MEAPEVDTAKVAGTESNIPENSDDSRALPGDPETVDPVPRKTLRSVLKGVIVRAVRHDCTEVAGEMAFDFSFSIFPAALFAATLAGLLNVSPMAVSESLEVVGVFLHDQVREMVEYNVRSLVETSSQPLLTLGLLGLEDYVPWMVSMLKMPAGFLGVISMACIIYRIAPNCRPSLLAVLPGAISFSILWYVLSQAFGTYVSNFSYYNHVTGTLGVMIVFQLWIYLTALLLLLGGELNAELDTSRNTSAA